MGIFLSKEFISCVLDGIAAAPFAVVVAAAAVAAVVVVEHSFLEHNYCWYLESVLGALASTPAAFSPKATLPLERGLGCPIVVFEGRAARTTAPARYFLTIDSETPWPERPPNSGRALSLETSSQISQVADGPATTTTANDRYITIYFETLWPERPPNSGTALSLATSSQFSQLGKLPASALARMTAMAAWCACRVHC